MKGTELQRGFLMALQELFNCASLITFDSKVLQNDEQKDS